MNRLTRIAAAAGATVALAGGSLAKVTGPNSNVMVNVYSTYYRIVYRGDGSLGFMPKADLRYVSCY